MMNLVANLLIISATSLFPLPSNKIAFVADRGAGESHIFGRSGQSQSCEDAVIDEAAKIITLRCEGVFSEANGIAVSGASFRRSGDRWINYSFEVVASGNLPGSRDRFFDGCIVLERLEDPFSYVPEVVPLYLDCDSSRVFTAGFE